MESISKKKKLMYARWLNIVMGFPGNSGARKLVARFNGIVNFAWQRRKCVKPFSRKAHARAHRPCSISFYLYLYFPQKVITPEPQQNGKTHPPPSFCHVGRRLFSAFHSRARARPIYACSCRRSAVSIWTGEVN